MVYIIKAKLLITGGKKGTPGDNPGAKLVSPVNDLSCRELLHRHSVDKQIVSPLDVIVI